MEMSFEELSEEQKLSCYESYVGDCIYENGDNAPYMSYEEWYKESEQFGEALPWSSSRTFTKRMK